MTTSSAVHPLPPNGDAPLDWELLFCTSVLGLPSLHWGMWDPSDPLTLEGLRAAQKRYTDHVVSVLPDDAREVLDVGCGTGDVARILARSGRRVTAIAPVANYESLLSDSVPNGVAWKRCSIQDFESDRSFDAVLMIESAGYFPIETGLARAGGLLRPGGWLLVANPFRRRPVAFQVAKHVLGDYDRAAADHGFTLVRSDDITDQVLPTLELVQRMHREHIEPGLAFLRYLAGRSRPVRLGMRAGSFIFRKRIRALRGRLDVYREELDPDLVREHARYLVRLYRYGGPSE